MSDFLREVDEEVRRDRVLDIWRKYGTIIIALAVLLVAGVGGWQFWNFRQQQQAQALGAQLEAALKTAREGEGDAGEKALASIASGSAPGYAMVARFRLAAEIARRDTVDGAKAFDALAADATLDPRFRELARVRSALLNVDALDYAAFRAIAEPLAGPQATWRHSMREMLGLSALKAGNFEDAGRWFDQIVIDRDAPQAVRQRADLYLAIVRAGPVETR
jgi:hypothetical protein